jgi:ribonuclease E
LALAAATLLVTIYLAIRLKTVHYLLQQPVVKKMSPQLRLKPVKLDEALDRNRNRDRGPGGPGDRGPGSRDGRDAGRPERRDGRPEGARGEGRDRRDGRPERSERPEGARDGERNRDGRRDGRPERSEGRRDDRRDGPRPERRDGDRRDSRPPREFSDAPRDAAPSSAAASSSSASSSSDYSAPAAETSTGLPPRRPLPSLQDSPVERPETSAPVRDSAADTFVGSGDDEQHGRRTQLKKKPRFDFDEEETTTPAV